ncbi:MAG: hypothetical protein LBS72_04265 [Oscillospiraceae bacterium]|jgi:hypothetical protein|nr:hypothetical protein [Oscillospiraceae bacterium]
MRKLLKRAFSVALAAIVALSAIALAAGAASAAVDNAEAPRSYFPYPSDLETLPDNFSLPDLFEFFNESADPNGSGRVDSEEEWEARAAELKDMLSYYVFGNRLDPLKSDTTITAINDNFSYAWVADINQGESTARGWTELPALPEGSYNLTVQDRTSRGEGIYYSNYSPIKTYVHSGDTFVSPGDYADWEDGDTWEDHTDIVTETLLPTKTVSILIKDTNPANEAYRSPEASEGVTHKFNIRFPEEPPVVDGVVRDEKASRNGAGYPVLVQVGGISEQQIRTLIENGYAYIAVDDSNNPDAGQISRYEALYPPEDPIVYNDNTIKTSYEVDSGDLMHTGWMASRALDAIENYMLLSDEEKALLHPNVVIPDIDVYSSAIMGCSNMAKRAFVGGFYDTGDNGNTRFDIIALSDPGGGGLTGFRYSTEGQLFSYEPPVQNSATGVVVHDYAYGLNESIQRAIQNSGEDHWFSDRAQIFTVRPDLADNTPFDLHAMVAAFATTAENRYFICWSGEGQDAWLNSPSTVVTMDAAAEVYEYIGQGDNIGMIIRDQAHANQDRDLPDLIAIMDHEYYGVDELVRKYHETLTINAATGEGDGLAAADGSGTILPTKTFDSVAAMSRNPYFLPSAYIDWSRPDKHVLWTESNSVTEGVPLTFTFHTDADTVELILTDGVTKLTGDVEDGIATISLTESEAKAGQYTATAIGGKDSKTIEISGWTVNDALRHSISDNSALGHDVGSGVAFTTPLVNYNSYTDPVRLYIDGKAIPADIYDYDNKVNAGTSTLPQSGYLQPYGATLILYPDTEGYRVPLGDKVVFGIRNAKIEALQGYVIALDVEYEKYDPNATNPLATTTRMRFRPTYKTLTPQTPVWKPNLLQNTPKSGLPEGEEYWPILGNWRSDYDENGDLKPVSEIRPTNSEAVESAYGAVLSVASADATGATIEFSAPVNPNDFGLAISGVKGVSFQWAENNESVRVVYDAPAASGTDISAFVFRSVDAEGNMIGGPVQLSFAY